MTWVDDIINKVLSTINTHSFTFKGKAMTCRYGKSMLSKGWKDGFDYATKNWKEGNEFKPFPEGFDYSIPYYSNGWAEGVISAINKQLDKLYPGAKQLTYNSITKKYDAIY